MPEAAATLRTQLIAAARRMTAAGLNKGTAGAKPAT